MTYDFNDIREFTESYNKLINILKNADAHYQRDSRFEQAIIESAKNLLELI